MRRTRLILPLAFAASVAFLWGCQEQASSPTGPDSGTTVPNFGHNDKAPRVHGGGDGEGNLDGTWEASTAEATASDVRVVEGNLVGPNGSKNTLQTAFNEPVKINLTVFRVLVADGTSCFGAGEFVAGEFDAIMQVGQVKPSNTEDAIISFFFRALGTDEPASDVDYVLKVFGTFEKNAPWPPTDDKSNTITGDSFVLAHVNGPGRKVACTGEGTITFTLLVELLLAA